MTIPEGVVATGTFKPVDGVTSGGVVASFDGETFTFDFPDFVTGDYEHILYVLADDELGKDDCFYDRYQLAFAEAIPDIPESKAMISVEQYSGDPSFFSTIAVLEYPTGPRVEGECWFSTLAIAALDWSIPDLHPDLVPTDAGEETGAMGRVTTDDSGAPLTYLTRAGDTWPAVAARFGMTPEELLYLNPCRPGVYEADLAYADELLNLSKERRGERL